MTVLVLLTLAVAGVLLLALHHQPRQETTMPEPQTLEHLPGCSDRVCLRGCPIAEAEILRPEIANIEERWSVVGVGKRWVDLGAFGVWDALGCTKPEQYAACEDIALRVLAIVQPVRDYEIKAAVAAEIRAELEPPIDRVRALHSQDDTYLAPGKWCPACGHETPCPTIRALNGDPQ